MSDTVCNERIDSLKTMHPILKPAGSDLAHAFEFISLLRMRHQLEQVTMNLKPDNFINPKKLNSLERRNLKEICKLTKNLLDDIGRRYHVDTQP